MTVNKFGKVLISTIKSLELNGRFSHGHDGCTSVSSLGASVVDYNITPIKSFSKLSNFKVLDPLLIASNNNINIDSSFPDHRIISVEFGIDSRLCHERKKHTKTNIKVMPSTYMLNEIPVQNFEKLADSLAEPACNIDGIYREFCRIIDSQLDSKSVTLNGSTNHSKAWWNEELSALAKEVRITCKKWENCKTDKNLKIAYLHKQSHFSKLVCSSKRKHRKARDNRLLQDQRSNPKKFWNFIKRIR